MLEFFPGISLSFPKKFLCWVFFRLSFFQNRRKKTLWSSTWCPQCKYVQVFTFEMVYIQNGLQLIWFASNIDCNQYGLHSKWFAFKMVCIHNGLHSKCFVHCKCFAFEKICSQFSCIQFVLHWKNFALYMFAVKFPPLKLLHWKKLHSHYMESHLVCWFAPWWPEMS